MPLSWAKARLWMACGTGTRFLCRNSRFRAHTHTDTHRTQKMRKQTERRGTNTDTETIRHIDTHTHTLSLSLSLSFFASCHFCDSLPRSGLMWSILYSASSILLVCHRGSAHPSSQTGMSPQNTEHTCASSFCLSLSRSPCLLLTAYCLFLYVARGVAVAQSPVRWA